MLPTMCRPPVNVLSTLAMAVVYSRATLMAPLLGRHAILVTRDLRGIRKEEDV